MYTKESQMRDYGNRAVAPSKIGHCTEEPKQAEIHREIDELNKRLECLNSIAESLSMRLGTVLIKTVEPLADESYEVPGEQCYSALGNAISNAGFKVKSIHRQLASLLDSLAL